MSTPKVAISADYLPGITLNTQLTPAQTPFDAESFAELFSDENFDKLQLNQLGTYKSHFQLSLTEKDKLKSLNVAGSMDVTFGPVTGDAHVEFAMKNTNDEFSLSLIYSNSHIGAQRRVDLSKLNSLKLSDAALKLIQNGMSPNGAGTENNKNMAIDEFTKKYGKYIIIGFEYGGEIMYDLTYKSKSKEDKMSVAGGLSLKYDKTPGFSISGSVVRYYKEEDIDKSLDITTNISISPSTTSDKQTELIKLFAKLSLASSSTPEELAKYKADIDTYVNEILNPNPEKESYTLDAVSAIILDITNIKCVSDAFTEIAENHKSIPYFFSYSNELYINLKTKYQTINTIIDHWKDNPPIDLLSKYGGSLYKLIQIMDTLSNEDKIYEYAQKYYDYLHSDDNKDNDNEEQIDIPASEFYKFNIFELDQQFKKDIMIPYEQAMAEAEEESKDQQDVVGLKDGWYAFQNVDNSKAIQVPDFSPNSPSITTPGLAINLWVMDKIRENQTFYIQEIGNGIYTVKSKASALFWAIKEASKDDGAFLIQDKQDENDVPPNQQFRFVENGNGGYYIFNVNSGKCLITGKVSNSTQITQVPPGVTPQQQWKLIPATV